LVMAWSCAGIDGHPQEGMGLGGNSAINQCFKNELNNGFKTTYR